VLDRAVAARPLVVGTECHADLAFMPAGFFSAPGNCARQTGLRHNLEIIDNARDAIDGSGDFLGFAFIVGGRYTPGQRHGIPI
jgi:hypothetical protein